MDRNQLQRLQTRPVGLAPQQNAGSWSCGTVLARDGGGPTLGGERGLSGRTAAAAARKSRRPTSNPPGSSSTHTACRSATATSLELRGAWTLGVSGGPVQRSCLAVRKAGARTVARNHHASQERIQAVAAATARETTEAQKAAEGGSTSQGGGLASSYPKNLYLKGPPDGVCVPLHPLAEELPLLGLGLLQLCPKNN